MGIRWWQIPAGAACAGLNLVFGAANLSFMSSQGGGVDAWQFLGLAGVIELGLVVAPFAIARWSHERRRLRQTAAAFFWLVCIGFSAHSLYGWLNTNFNATKATVAQSVDAKQTLRDDLQAERGHLKEVNTGLLGKLRELQRKALESERDKTETRIKAIVDKLSSVKVETKAAPLEGFDLAATVALVLLNSIAWFAFFGDGEASPKSATVESIPSRERQPVAPALEPPVEAPLAEPKEARNEPQDDSPAPSKRKAKRKRRSARRQAQTATVLPFKPRGEPSLNAPSHDATQMPLNEAVKAWLLENATFEPEGTLRASDALASFANAPLGKRYMEGMRRDDARDATSQAFFKALKGALEGHERKRTSAGYMYRGVALAPSQQATVEGA